MDKHEKSFKKQVSCLFDFGPNVLSHHTVMIPKLEQLNFENLLLAVLSVVTVVIFSILSNKLHATCEQVAPSQYTFN